MKKYAVILLAVFAGFFGESKAQSQSSSSNQPVVVEVWSDVVCPYCFLGKRKMEKAIKKLEAENKVQVVWRSFQLDPNFPKDTSIASIDYLTQKRGYPKEGLLKAMDALNKKGKNYGITYNFETAKNFNTYDVHRLLKWAAQFGKASELKDVIMTEYFTNGAQLIDKTTLSSTVSKVGLDPKKALSILNSLQYATEVKNDITKAKQIGVRGVPFFLINGKQTISGAQDDKTFEKTLAKALKNAK